MKLLVFEPFSGASGDMIIGSLLDLGIEEAKIEDAISVFDLKMEVKEVEKRGINAKKVQFVSKGNKHSEREQSVKSYEEIVKAIANSGLNKEIISNS